MKLTGQCLRDFEKWFHLDHCKDDPNNKVTHRKFTKHFWNKHPSEKYGVIVDFADSVGDVIGLNSTTRHSDEQIFRVYVNKIKINPHPTNRHEARTAAVEKFNEIYNQRTKPGRFRVC